MRAVPFALVIALLPVAPCGAATVPGVWVYSDGTVHIIATMADHNVLSITEEAATDSFVITLNGTTARRPRGIKTVSLYYRGGAGGSDEVTLSTPSLVVTADLFGQHNHAVVPSGSYSDLNLYGDQDVVDVQGYALIKAYGGAHNVYNPSSKVTLATNQPYCIPTTIPGVFTYGSAIGTSKLLTLGIVSPAGQGNQATVSENTAAKTITVTENGATATIDETGVLITGTTYYGSGNGADVLGYDASPAFTAWIQGDGNQLTIAHASQGVVYTGGSNDAIAAAGVLGNAFIWGSGTSVTGLTKHAEGAAPTLATSSGSGTTSGGTTSTGTTTSGASTSGGSGGGGSTGSGSGGGINGGAVTGPASGGGGHDCGFSGGSLGLLLTALAVQARRRRATVSLPRR